MVLRAGASRLEIAPMGVEPVDPALIREPIEFLFAEHCRQRAVLNHLDWISRDATGNPCVKIAQMSLDFLLNDLPNHVSDEEEDLFPILRARCGWEDQVEAVFDVLTKEHAADEILARAVIEGLRMIAQSSIGRVDTGLQIPIRAFVETQRRHLSWENALVLPLARRRLTAEDLHQLAGRMAARRDIASPALLSIRADPPARLQKAARGRREPA
jgi:hemerythrin-like domain-containing protein